MDGRNIIPLVALLTFFISYDLFYGDVWRIAYRRKKLLRFHFGRLG